MASPAGRSWTSAPAERAEARPQKALLRDYIETILICVIFVIFSRAFVFQQSKIPSGSMMDTLLAGDYIMVNRFIYSDQSLPFETGEVAMPLRDRDAAVTVDDDLPHRRHHLPHVVAGLPRRRPQ
mgnify:CR=1 FL=1